jgi:hypothetical protein
VSPTQATAALGETLSAARIGNLITHSWPVQAAGVALIGALVTWAVAAFRNRKRIAWRPYLDTPVKLAPHQVKSMGALSYKIYFDDAQPGTRASGNGGATPGSEVETPWLVLLRVRNSGFVPIDGKDFNTPLTFIFPGRTLRGAEVIERSGDSAAKILQQPKPGVQPRRPRLPSPARLLHAWWTNVSERALEAGGMRGADSTASQLRAAPARTARTARNPPADRIQLSKEFLLNRKDRFTLMVLLNGIPADKGKKIDQDGRSPP